MKKMKRWLIQRCLPIWARQELEAENRRLQQENENLRLTAGLREEYIRGLEAGLRAQRRIVIQTGEVKKG